MAKVNVIPEVIEFVVPYVPSVEGPVGVAARWFWREERSAVPNELRIRTLIQEAFPNGYILRQRYDDHVRRHTRLTFKRRPRYPHPPSADFLP